MAYFALLWKARTIEKCRLKYERQKLNSIRLSDPLNQKKSLYKRLKQYNCDAVKKVTRKLKKLIPEGSTRHGCFYYSTIDQTFPNFVLKSVIGFVGGIILTYLCFMFFVFQLDISLNHATIMSSIIGVLLTLGLAFSYRIRCLVFLLIPQFFSRVGRYTLTCYALVLILTGPATNTMKNAEVLSESMACKQEQIKSNVRLINESMERPFSSLKDNIQILIDKVRRIAASMKIVMTKLQRLVINMAQTLQSTSLYLDSVIITCNKKLGTPYEMCTAAVEKGVRDCQAAFGVHGSWICNNAIIADLLCTSVKPLPHLCVLFEFVNSNIVGNVENELNAFMDRMNSMLELEVQVQRSYTFNSNSSRSESQVAAGVMTEIRRRTYPLLTWLSWSSCVTSLFLLLIIFRAKYYQNMFETRSRFDNRYITKELRELDLKRMRQGRATVLPLNRREKAKYITTTSFRLVSNEKVHLSRSAVYMVISTFKLLIHIVADYSLYWVLITIRYYGRFQTPTLFGANDPTVVVTGAGLLRKFFEALLDALKLPLQIPVPSPISCLPDPNPPDLQRYAQIGVLIILLWFFAMFEPYGLRLRHVIMGMYRPERAKARALWLFNHIQRTRGGFMKFARRKLHRENKYSSEAKHTLRNWMNNRIQCIWLKKFLGINPYEPSCLLCGTIENYYDPDTRLERCETKNCLGIFCVRCFSDIGDLCTICLLPVDYGDMSDISLEKGSSDESDDGDNSNYHPLKVISTDFGPDDDEDRFKVQTDDSKLKVNIDLNANYSHSNAFRNSDNTKEKVRKAKDRNKEDTPLLLTDNTASDESSHSHKNKCKRVRHRKRYCEQRTTKACDDSSLNSAKFNFEQSDCGDSSICLLETEFKSAIDIASKRTYFKKNEDNIVTDNIEIQNVIKENKEKLCDKTYQCIMPNSGQTTLNYLEQHTMKKIQPTSPKHSNSKKLRRKVYFCKEKQKGSRRICGFRACKLKFSKAHIFLTQNHYVTKAAKRLQRKFHLIRRHKKHKDKLFKQWCQRLTKHLRCRRRIFSKVVKDDGQKNYNRKSKSHGKHEKGGKSHSLENENSGAQHHKLLRRQKHHQSISKKIRENNKILNICMKKKSTFRFIKTKRLRRERVFGREENAIMQPATNNDTEGMKKRGIFSYLTKNVCMKRRDAQYLAQTSRTKSVNGIKINETIKEAIYKDVENGTKQKDIDMSRSKNRSDLDTSLDILKSEVDNKSHAGKIISSIPRMLRSLSIIYSCFFGGLKRNERDIELSTVEKTVVVQPVAKTCVLPEFVTNTVAIEPKFNNARPVMTHELSHAESATSSLRPINSANSTYTIGESIDSTSEERKTDTTLYAITTTTIGYVDEQPKLYNKCEDINNDVTWNARSTDSETTRLSDTSKGISDWWSPISERRNSELEKKDCSFPKSTNSESEGNNSKFAKNGNNQFEVNERRKSIPKKIHRISNINDTSMMKKECRNLEKSTPLKKKEKIHSEAKKSGKISERNNFERKGIPEKEYNLFAVPKTSESPVVTPRFTVNTSQSPSSTADDVTSISTDKVVRFKMHVQIIPNGEFVSNYYILLRNRPQAV